MARKVILDVDPGIDDALALCLALFDPRLEVLAVTAVAGNVSSQQATRNVQTIIEQLDPPRWPRLGAASPNEQGAGVNARYIHGADGLGNAHFDVAELHHLNDSEKVIGDILRSNPDEVSLVCLGPLTNVAGAFRRDPVLPTLIDRLIFMGGTYLAPGNVTPVAEFNMAADPVAAREVFHSRTTKTMVPLDVTSPVTLSYDFLDELPGDTSRVGRFLRRILPFAYRAYRQHYGLESIHVHDAVALQILLRRDLFLIEEVAADIETAGELTTGATIFDRRANRQWRENMEVAIRTDPAAVKREIVEGIRRAARAAG